MIVVLCLFQIAKRRRTAKLAPKKVNTFSPNINVINNYFTVVHVRVCKGVLRRFHNVLKKYVVGCPSKSDAGNKFEKCSVRRNIIQTLQSIEVY